MQEDHKKIQSKLEDDGQLAAYRSINIPAGITYYFHALHQALRCAKTFPFNLQVFIQTFQGKQKRVRIRLMCVQMRWGKEGW